MTTITTRSGKGSALTHNEVDTNFENLNTDKVETSAIGSTVQAYDSNLTSFVGTFTLPTTDGTADQVLKTDGAGALTFVDQSGGLTYFGDSESTTSPNDTVPVDALTVANSGTNVDVALVAKGTGATLAQVPDSTTAGGNKRGNYATDWQKIRSNATQVASGDYSVVLGGYNNVASGVNSVVAGGSNKFATGAYSFVGPYGDEASATGTVSMSYAATASAVYAGAYGYRSIADAEGSWTSGGRYARTHLRETAHVLTCTGSLTILSQVTVQNLYGYTSQFLDTRKLSADYSGATSDPYLTPIPANTCSIVRVMVLGRVYNAGPAKAWEMTFLIKRGTSGVPSIVGSVAKNIIAADSGTSSWDVDVFIGTTDAFGIEVTGQSGTSNVEWAANLYIVENF